MAQKLTLEGGGHLEWTQEGALIRLNVRRVLDGSGLYKVWLRGSLGEYLLGTLIPEGQQLTLERTVSRDTLAQAGCWPVTGGRCAMAFSFSEAEPEPASSPWHWDHAPFRRFPDPVLAEAAAAWGSMLVREGTWGFQLAIPMDSHHPFPLLPLFCLASILSIDGQPHVTFTFLPSGEPKFPELP